MHRGAIAPSYFILSSSSKTNIEQPFRTPQNQKKGAPNRGREDPLKFHRDYFYHRKGSTQRRTDDYEIKNNQVRKGQKFTLSCLMAISEKKLM